MVAAKPEDFRRSRLVPMRRAPFRALLLPHRSVLLGLSLRPSVWRASSRLRRVFLRWNVAHMEASTPPARARLGFFPPVPGALAPTPQRAARAKPQTFGLARIFSSAARFLTLERGAMEASTPPAGARLGFFPPVPGALAPTPQRAARAKPQTFGLARIFSSAAHFLTLERGAMEASTPPAGGALAVP